MEENIWQRRNERFVVLCYRLTMVLAFNYASVRSEIPFSNVTSLLQLHTRFNKGVSDISRFRYNATNTSIYWRRSLSIITFHVPWACKIQLLPISGNLRNSCKKAKIAESRTNLKKRNEEEDEKNNYFTQHLRHWYVHYSFSTFLFFNSFSRQTSIMFPWKDHSYT